MWLENLRRHNAQKNKSKDKVRFTAYEKGAGGV